MASINTSTTHFLPEVKPQQGEMTLEAAEILRLIAAHLTECGLSHTSRVLQQESGIGAAGCIRAVHSNLKAWALRGEWGTILESLATLDKAKCCKTIVMTTNHTTTNNNNTTAESILEHLLADVHEMAILELAAAGDMALAYATLRLVEDDLDKLPAASSHDNNSNTNNNKKTNEYNLSRKRDLEQRLAALVSLRSAAATADNNNNDLPPNFYGSSNRTKQERRDDIGTRLTETIPMVPKSRLTSLLQQALKWQAYTGLLPRIRNHWSHQEEEDIVTMATANDDITSNTNDNNINKKRPKKRKRKVFDLVLGEVEMDAVMVGDTPLEDAVPLDPIPSKPYTTIKFGKKATAESALFCPDQVVADAPATTTFSLVTGSSDGLVELYDAHDKYNSLRMDLKYQQEDELMGHDLGTSVLAMAVTADGTMLATGNTKGVAKIWNIATGKCLRTIPAHDAPITCLAFAPDMAHILTAGHDANCREFGLRTSRMLKEFRGHSSYIYTCQYVLRKGGQQLNVVTSSADGTVRIWSAKTLQVIRALRPVSLGDVLSAVKTSVTVNQQSDLTSGGSPAIHSVLYLHTPADTMIIVPRGKRAFLVNFQGTVLRTFDDDTGKVFVAATVSPSNHWLYCVTEEGICCVFDIASGKLEKSIRSFGEETTSKSKDGGVRAEITQLVHHPQKGILAAFSNNKGQKKGQLVLWK
ncbi:repeat-containing protein SMU1 [Seminavis robusta]|uniref:Repeat-containing protein SMU1 n=1 Tax=Seminavis robusta TaxID=568900 RepID=A0A9N8D9F8_9STRA|nr:repeat-containing protein SMU1 [Seminavis robusta]|eukprot:Sro50_g029250.1 repeat-containing protein SMU1 (698) ;mRNA; f:127855-129948